MITKIQEYINDQTKYTERQLESGITRIDTEELLIVLKCTKDMLDELEPKENNK